MLPTPADRPAALTIRPLREAELPLVATLAHRIWPEVYAGVLKPAEIGNILERIYHPAALADEMAAGHRFWTAHEGENAVAYASAYREDDIVWLKKLYVLPRAQGGGIGKRLIAAVIDAFAPAREMRLLVNRDNHAAQGFYLHNGFVPRGEAPVRMGDYAFVDLVFARAL
jgi:diamine N-acetyltransferase